MNKRNSAFLVLLTILLVFHSCSDTAKVSDKTATVTTVYQSDVIPIFNHFKLILGDGSNVGTPVYFENKDFFYTTKEDNTEWVVYKTPNAGNTHGTSNNTRTELGQSKKWSPMTKAKLTATCKVMNVSLTGDARVAASYSVVIGLSLIHI